MYVILVNLNLLFFLCVLVCMWPLSQRLLVPLSFDIEIFVDVS